MSETVVAVERVSKKFCRNLKRGMLYTTVDVARDALGFPSPGDRLRPAEFWALRDVSFSLRRGQCLGVIGANGAGKSTILKLLNGILRPEEGTIRLRGRVGALIEVGAGFHPMLTGRENIYVNAAILGMSKREVDRKFEAIIDFAGLDAAILDAPVKTYSSGMYVRLGFAVAAHCDPDILLIDEVLAVGDMGFQAKCLNTLGSIRTRGTTVVLVSHNLNHIAGWADEVVAIAGGRMIAHASPREAIQAYAEAQARLGKPDAPEKRLANGSGRAVIREVRLLDAAGRPCERLAVGEPLAVGIALECREALADAEVDLKLFDENNRLVTGASSRYTDGALSLPAGPCEVRAEYPPLPVNRGFLRASVALWRGGRSELLDWVECPAVPVAGLAASQGDLWWAPTYRVLALEPPRRQERQEKS